jgi:hypothetical protein
MSKTKSKAPTRRAASAKPAGTPPGATPRPVWPPLTDAERAAAQEQAAQFMDRVRRMTPARRRKLIADFERTSKTFDRDNHATPAAAGSDLLLVIQAAAMEWLALYYPTAESANLFVTLPAPLASERTLSARLPLPVPNPGGRT